jgi:hypothetical protein
MKFVPVETLEQVIGVALSGGALADNAVGSAPAR